MKKVDTHAYTCMHARIQARDHTQRKRKIERISEWEVMGEKKES